MAVLETLYVAFKLTAAVLLVHLSFASKLLPPPLNSFKYVNDYQNYIHFCPNWVHAEAVVLTSAYIEDH